MYYSAQTEVFFRNPIIAAVRDSKFLPEALNSEATSIFLLTGSLLDIDKIVKICKEKHKYVFIHTDLVEGLGNIMPPIVKTRKNSSKLSSFSCLYVQATL